MQGQDPPDVRAVVADDGHDPDHVPPQPRHTDHLPPGD